MAQPLESTKIQAVIYDSCDNVQKYSPPGDSIWRAVRFVLTFDKSLPDGRYEIDGDNVFAIVQTATTRPAAEKLFEAHRAYIDVQMVLDGSERHDVALRGAQDLRTVGEYDSDKDIIFFSQPPQFSTIIMNPGMFAVYGPEDAHRPCCAVGGHTVIRKVCVKIKHTRASLKHPVSV